MIFKHKSDKSPKIKDYRIVKKFSYFPRFHEHTNETIWLESYYSYEIYTYSCGESRMQELNGDYSHYSGQAKESESVGLLSIAEMYEDERDDKREEIIREMKIVGWYERYWIPARYYTAEPQLNCKVDTSSWTKVLTDFETEYFGSMVD